MYHELASNFVFHLKQRNFQLPSFIYRYSFPFRFTSFQRCKKGVNFKSGTLNPLVFRVFQDFYSILPWQMKSTFIIFRILYTSEFFSIVVLLIYFISHQYS